MSPWIHLIRRSLAVLLLISVMLGSYGLASASGTLQLVQDINTLTNPIPNTSGCESGSSSPQSFTFTTNFYFVACVGKDNYGIYKLSPQANTPVLFKGGLTNVSMLVEIGDKLYFRSGTDGRELWVSDGTAGGTVKLHTSAQYQPELLTASGTMLYFVGYDTVYGKEVWKTDGTVGGTTRITSMSGNPYDIVNVGVTVYFPEAGATNRLWKITGGGLSIVADNLAKPPTKLIAVGATLYFRGYDPVNEWEVWKTTLNNVGTTITVRVTSLSESSGPDNLTDGGTAYRSMVHQMYFTARAGSYNYVYRSDAQGTIPVQGFETTTSLTSLTNVNGRLFFMVNYINLWTLDSGYVIGFPVGIYNLFAGDQLYLTLYDSSPVELWRSNGTTAGTTMISPNLNVSLDSVTYFAGKVYFPASDGVQGQGGMHGHELWSYTP